MEAKDLLEAKAIWGENKGLSQYEQIKVNKMQQHAGGVAIGALCVGIGGTIVGVAGALWAGAKAQNAKETSRALIAGVDKQIDKIGTLLETEVNRRISGDITLNQTITDTISGQQTTSQNQQLNNDLTLGLMTGEYERRPQRVALYRDQQACDCPASGGCCQR